MSNVQVKGCGCRYRDKEGCEYLCDTHRNEFILKLYNQEIEMRIFTEEMNSENAKRIYGYSEVEPIDDNNNS